MRVRRTRVLSAGFVAAVGAALVFAGPAYAEKGTGPYFWDCGSSRSGGMHVEAFGQEIRVEVKPNGGGSTVRTFSGSVSVDVPGGPVGTGYVQVSNEGSISPKTREFCSGRP